MFNVYDFGRNIGYLYRDISGGRTGQILRAYQDLYLNTRRWDEKRAEIEKNATRVEAANKAFMKVQRLFVAPEGLPGREFWRHILYAPNRDDGELMAFLLSYFLFFGVELVC